MIEIKISIPGDFVPSGNLLTETARYLAAINGMKMIDDDAPVAVMAPDGSSFGEIVEVPVKVEVGAGSDSIERGDSQDTLITEVYEKPIKTRKKKEVPPPPAVIAVVPVPEAPPAMTKDIFMSKITAAISEKQLTYTDVSAACIAVGVANLPEACGKPELFAEIHKILGVK